ncbi:MAG TPA: hypothetical protein PKZ84_23450 [Anaerolineae bacterium]|nr:hypothetical protein [Anaerolineae bacterium]HQI85604.1 hypothetical protein [Anaerolineae bacterium]
MTLQTISVKIPGTLYRRLQTTAALTKQSLDEIVAQTLHANVPPSLDDAPPDMHTELSALLTASTDDVWAVAHSVLDAQQWRRHQDLLFRNAEQTLTDAERAELEQLRRETDRYVLRKSFALAILKWRGYTLPGES